MSDAPVISAWRLPSLGPFRGVANAVIGIAALLALWWVGGKLVENSPGMFAFANFGFTVGWKLPDGTANLARFVDTHNQRECAAIWQQAE